MAQIETLNSFLTFRLGDELFAANVSKVLEILEIPKITKVPRSPEFMRGVINLRGSVLPVIRHTGQVWIATNSGHDQYLHNCNECGAGWPRHYHRGHC